MNWRNPRATVALALPIIAAVLAPTGIAGCDDDKRRHNTIIVAPQERHENRATTAAASRTETSTATRRSIETGNSAYVIAPRAVMERATPRGLALSRGRSGTSIAEPFLVRRTPGPRVDQANDRENGDSAMLVSSRKQLRSVVIGDPNGCHLMLNVTMVELRGGGVRLGLEVNTDSPVHRGEISDRSRASGPSAYSAGCATGQAGAP